MKIVAPDWRRLLPSDIPNEQWSEITYGDLEVNSDGLVRVRGSKGKGGARIIDGTLVEWMGI